MNIEEKKAIVQKYATILAEHFQHIIIFASTEDKDGTDFVVGKTGNYYAQMGMLEEYRLSRDEELRDDVRKTTNEDTDSSEKRI